METSVKFIMKILNLKTDFILICYVKYPKGIINRWDF
jgi:hypothetical protein